MLVEDLKAIEKEYFRNHYEMVIPELLCAYYENAEYELTYYLSKEYVRQFGNAEFYLMMSLPLCGGDHRPAPPGPPADRRLRHRSGFAGHRPGLGAAQG